MRVRWESKQKAHVRAKCVRAKTSKCDVRACDGKIIALQYSGSFLQGFFCNNFWKNPIKNWQNNVVLKTDFNLIMIEAEFLKTTTVVERYHNRCKNPHYSPWNSSFLPHISAEKKGKYLLKESYAYLHLLWQCGCGISPHWR